MRQREVGRSLYTQTGTIASVLVVQGDIDRTCMRAIYYPSFYFLLPPAPTYCIFLPLFNYHGEPANEQTEVAKWGVFLRQCCIKKQNKTAKVDVNMPGNHQHFFFFGHFSSSFFIFFYTSSLKPI